MKQFISIYFWIFTQESSEGKVQNESRISIVECTVLQVSFFSFRVPELKISRPHSSPCKLLLIQVVPHILLRFFLTYVIIFP